MRERILLTVVGKTDPIRGEHDGPILHIIRHYRPKKAILLLSEEVAGEEDEYHHNREAIGLLDPDCQVETVHTGIQDVHSYDAFALTLLSVCSRIRELHPEKEILINITSGTPQLETALCMIAIADPEHYTAIQVVSPERSANKAPMFNPKRDLIEEWFETDVDNEEGSPSRCHAPRLLNFKRPMVQFQIQSLIENYDYSGALLLYQENRENFSERTGLLLEHARRRLNLEHKEAEQTAVKLDMKEELYPIRRSDIAQLTEFYNSMRIKQVRGELNDFSMRLEIMTLYTGRYLMEKCMRVRLEDVTVGRSLKNSHIMYLDRDKCTGKIPGIQGYLDERFSDKKSGRFEWGKPVNALSIVHIVKFLSTQPGNEKYRQAADEMIRWAALSGQVRNPAAHTIVAITDEIIRESYDNKDSAALVKSIYTVLRQAFGSQWKEEAFEIYGRINVLIKQAMENSDG
ncbi:MAG: hypothetical protein HFG75_06635 [Hungatella sp.]|nr:hypothetical protein [Hungatella sp.]